MKIAEKAAIGQCNRWAVLIVEARMKGWLLFCTLFGGPALARADSWDSPKTTDYYSADSSYFLRVVPTFVPAKYHEWLQASVKKKRRYAPTDTLMVHCHATLLHRVSQQSVAVWHQDLINRIAPQHVLVSNDGRYVVTLDNWASLGYGLDVVVVYDEKGALRKRVQLDAVSPYPLNDYWLSISSLWWRCGAKFTDTKTVELCFLDKNKHTITKRFILPELLAE
jgi:hypothetical protein